MYIYIYIDRSACRLSRQLGVGKDLRILSNIRHIGKHSLEDFLVGCIINTVTVVAGMLAILGCYPHYVSYYGSENLMTSTTVPSRNSRGALGCRLNQDLLKRQHSQRTVEDSSQDQRVLRQQWCSLWGGVLEIRS